MSASPLDLTTLAEVKNWIPGANVSTTDDAILQECITSWSTDFLNRTGLGDQNGDNAQSPFAQVCTFNETYDGGGSYRQMLRNRPVVNVSAVMVCGVAIPQSSGYFVPGWVLDGSGKSISIRPTGWGYAQWNSYQAGPYHALGQGPGFVRGIQNVNVQYSAGYPVTPADIAECAKKVVAINYRRRSWVDEASRSVVGGGGTTRYRDWEIPPECQRVVDRYTRTL